mgnify:CR=1 FL=1
MVRPWKQRIRPGTRVIMDALFDAIIPSEGRDRPGAADFNLVERLLDWLGAIPLAAPGFILLCIAWDFSPLLFLRFRRFHRLTFEERTWIFERFESGGFFRRWAFVLFKSVIMAAFYRNPEVWPLIGYHEGCLSPLPDGAKIEE